MSELKIIDCYARYLDQISKDGNILKKACTNYPKTAKEILLFFQARFSPIEEKQKITSPLLDMVQEQQFKDIFEKFISLIKATARTNAYCPKAKTMAIKVIDFDQNRQSPQNLIEIFVNHESFQGILLKSKPISRGGIRWSDRKDFRKECLDLLQTQIVKNTVIIPAGAKGCFFINKATPNPAEALECYKLFIDSILALADNLEDLTAVHPKNIKCYDDFDFYNVVGADKGTASFSDFANQISCARGYWLGDAFASGGIHGYNHKKLGITSRGVWISVLHHRNNITPAVSGPITVVGVGDMSGDVFGNGLLQDRNLKLLAAFNHDHIFIDPDPNSELSYQERCRLFHLSRSTWDDYDRQKLSLGGAIFSRKEKSLELSQEARDLLGLQSNVVDPNTVIRHILQQPVDLLWMGGIGTFIKASNETDVKDSHNDDIRVFASQVKAKIIAEGGNLSITQRGRIEYALAGGGINTDAVDNSAGVNCSDHEVNIKILLDMAIKHKKISEKQRNQMLQEIETEVCALVLKENEWQNIAISWLCLQGSAALTSLQGFLSVLQEEKITHKDFPDFSLEEIELRKSCNIGLLRPEAAMFLAYSRLHFMKMLEQISLNEFGKIEVLNYFPLLIQENFSETIEQHLLYDSIRKTMIGSAIVNLFGPYLIYELAMKLNILFTEALKFAFDFYTIFNGARIEQKIESLFKTPQLIYPILENFQKLFTLSVTYATNNNLTLQKMLFSDNLPAEILKLKVKLAEVIKIVTIP